MGGLVGGMCRWALKVDRLELRKNAFSTDLPVLCFFEKG